MRILVTGAAGWTSAAILERLLSSSHEVVGFDLPDAAFAHNLRPLCADWREGDVAVSGDVETAIAGADALIHLAVAIDPSEYEVPPRAFRTNVLGTYNIFESARKKGVGKIVMMSSAPVHLAVDPCGDGLSWRSSAGEDHVYDLTKRIQEVIAEDFCDTHSMSAATLRAGHIVDGREAVDPKGVPLVDLRYCRGGWVCRHDVAQACLGALRRDLDGYELYCVIGAEKARANYDVDRTERELGFSFSSRFEEFPP